MSSELFGDDQLKGLTIEDFMVVRFDEVEKVHEYIRMPLGIYRGRVEPLDTFTVPADPAKKRPETQGVQIRIAVIEVVELKNEADDAETAQTIIEVEQKAQIGYLPGFGFRKLATDWADVAVELDAPSLEELSEKLPGTIVEFEVSHKRNKNDPENPYERIGNIVIAK